MEVDANRERAPRAFRRNPHGMIGWFGVLFLIAVTLLTPMIAPFAPDMVDAGPKAIAPTWAYLMGTDEYGRDTAKYRATLGHKINHSFNKWNCLFHNLDHPRFGLIPAARTTESVAAGDELLCNYQQEYDQAAPWFQELYRQQIDRDFVFGPFGHRGNKTVETGEAIRPMLANSSLYKEFYKHAVEVLKLDPNAL